MKRFDDLLVSYCFNTYLTFHRDEKFDDLLEMLMKRFRHTFSEIFLRIRVFCRGIPVNVLEFVCRHPFLIRNILTNNLGGS